VVKRIENVNFYGLNYILLPPPLFFSQLPYVSNVQVEPIVIQIDKLDLVLEENSESDASSGPNR
jgi:hypothetical protein